MGEYSQENRFIQVLTPLPADTLLLAGFHGHEGVSRLFNFELRMHSDKLRLPFNELVGKSMTINLLLPDNSVRHINGIVSTFTQGGKWRLLDEGSTTLANYNATLVPWLWVLTRTGDCRIFQDMSVLDIIKQIFDEHKFRDFDFRLKPEDFKKREYCVQYRETDFNFVSRLMEEEGIFYFFEHYEKKHVLVLANQNIKFTKSASPFDVINYDQEGDCVIREWRTSQEVRPGMYTVNDFNFIMPSLDLSFSAAPNGASANGTSERKLEIYDYPSEFINKEQGERLAKLRLEEEQSSMEVTTGSGNCLGLSAGYQFSLKGHYRSDFNRGYVTISVYHSGEQGMNYRSTAESAAADFVYANEFQCINSGTPYRSARVTPVPIVHGSQTAIVVGENNEEIDVDQYGRVKVQFHWDREGKYNEKSSCWVRVSQNWAGKRWGAIFLPRIGQEVIVDFLEGDPDKPIITGRVYNGESMPPYDLLKYKTISGIKTNSTKGGGGFNEIRFDDLKGKEQVFIHAERDHDIRIKHDRLEWVGNESHLIVKNDLLESVEGNQHLTVKSDRNDKVGGTVSLLAGSDILQKTGSRYALDAAHEIHLKSGSNLVIETGDSLTLKVGGNFININQGGIYIQGALVMINSGGEAGSGAGSSPKPPRSPSEADHADPGKKHQLPPPKQVAETEAHDAGEVQLRQATQIRPADTPPAQGSQQQAPLSTGPESVKEPKGTVTAPAPAVRDASGISENGLQFIAEWEGFVPTPYNDAANHATIGFGHLMHYGPVTEADRKKFSKGLTREQGLELLRKDAAIAENAVRSKIKVPLNQNQFDALTSFTYNVGNEAFAKSTLLKQLNAGNFAAVPEQLNKWVNSGGRKVQGLVNRRVAEGKLFSKEP